MHLSLRAKFAILTGAAVLAVAVLLTTVLTVQQERTIRRELLNRAVALTENLAYNCQLPLAAENELSLHHLAQGLFKQAEVDYVRFKDSHGVELHSEAEGSGWPYEIVDVRDEMRRPSGTVTVWVTTRSGRTFLDVQTAVVVEANADSDDILATQRQTEDVVLGSVEVGLSTQPAEALMARVRQLGTQLGIVVALAGSLLAAILIRFVTRPLGQLMEGNRRVARGDFSLRLAVRSGDEFGRLAGSYNQMADEIQRSRELAESYLASLRSNAENLEEANRALQQSNAELAKANRMKSEFLAMVSHELRTPLNVIIGFSEVLLDQTVGAINAKQRRYVENVVTSGQHLLALINDILDLSKVEAGRMRVVPEPFDLRQAFDEIQGQARNLAAKKNITVVVDPAPTLTPVTDQKLFKQVMLNLLSNAIKFTPEGGRVGFAVRCIDGRALRSDVSARGLAPERQLSILSRRVLQVEVQDTGVGIAPEDHERIFSAFQQVDASYSRQQQGTGLGLALTRRLVHLLGGDIWFKSALGEGSTFWFYVPLEFQEGDDRLVEPIEGTPFDSSMEADAPAPSYESGFEESGVPVGDWPAGPRQVESETEPPPGEWPWGAAPSVDAVIGEEGASATATDAEEGAVQASVADEHDNAGSGAPPASVSSETGEGPVEIGGEPVEVVAEPVGVEVQPDEAVMEPVEAVEPREVVQPVEVAAEQVDPASDVDDEAGEELELDLELELESAHPLVVSRARTRVHPGARPRRAEPRPPSKSQPGGNRR